jgi:TorA maturation chaperone TorD
MDMMKKIDTLDVLNEEANIRTDIYSLLATLFREAPQVSLLQWVSELELEEEPSSDISNAWLTLKKAAQITTQIQVSEEYQLVFIGIGCGEVVPYASWYLSGAMMDTPLVRLRKDLRELGFMRQSHVKEPEDHIAALLEVMAFLNQENDEKQQSAFFNRHLVNWYSAFFDDLEKADSAIFYKAVGQLAKSFLDIEKNRFI